jgi:hypothetical protein
MLHFLRCFNFTYQLCEIVCAHFRTGAFTRTVISEALNNITTRIKHIGTKYSCYPLQLTQTSSDNTSQVHGIHFINNTMSIRNWTNKIPTHTTHIARSNNNSSCPPGTHLDSFAFAAPDQYVSSISDCFCFFTLNAELFLLVFGPVGVLSRRVNAACP